MTKLIDELKTQVHVWYCDPRTIQDESKLAAYESVLSEREVQQYRRFQFDKDRHSYLVSHALLRYSLSQYADVNASKWRFSRNEHGKPELISPHNMQGIHFNLTHTEGLSACVVTLEKPCGIDAENKNRNNKLEAVASRMFADEECRQLNKNEIEQMFFCYWTLREAYVKALGTGLSGSSKEFYFDINIDEMKAVVHHRNRQQAVDDNWRFRLYEPTAEHVLSVAFKSDNPAEVKLRELIP